MYSDAIKYGKKFISNRKQQKNINMKNNSEKSNPFDILKYTLSIGASIAIVIVGYKIIRANENKRIAQELVDNVEVNKNNLTYDLSKYNEFADSLYYAMKGIGTDEKTIYRTIQKLKTKDDWNMLIKVFGVRKDENLLLWLEDDLGDNEYKYVMDYVNNVLV